MSFWGVECQTSVDPSPLAVMTRSSRSPAAGFRAMYAIEAPSGDQHGWLV